MPNKRADGQSFHGFACHDDLWAQVLAVAQAQSVTASEVIRNALEAHVSTALTDPHSTHPE